MELRDQLRDYQFRGEALTAMNLYDFLVNTYEDTLRDEDVETESFAQRKAGAAGRPRKRRIPYLSHAEKPKKCRIERTPGHEILPRFIGKWFARNNNPDGDNELHDASILLFFKPWRNIRDLKKSDETFQSSFARFLETATEKQRIMVENIQYYHDCWDVAQKRRDAFREGKDFKLFDYEQEIMPAMNDDECMETDDVEETPGEIPRATTQHVTEERIETARLQQRKECDRAFARQAMLLARAANIFGDEYRQTVRTSESAGLERRATQDDMKIFIAWEAILRDMTRKQLDEEGETNLNRIHLYSNPANTKPTIQLETSDKEAVPHTTDDANDLHVPQPTPSIRPKLDMLNADQRKAHDIIERHMFGDSEYERLQSVCKILTDIYRR